MVDLMIIILMTWRQNDSQFRGPQWINQ